MQTLKMLTALSAAALAVGFAGNAAALDLYAKASVGTATNVEASGVSLDGGLAFEGALGADLGLVRIEGNVSRIDADAFAGAIDASAWTYGGTAYLDIPLGERATLFGGAGLDYVDAEADFGYGSLGADGWGHHLTAGVGYRLGSNTTVEVSYRRLSAELDSDYGDIDVDADTVMAGVRVKL